MPIKIALISDTHGILRQEAEGVLKKCQLIIHAGDLDNAQVLMRLKQIAPLTVVKGNMDFGPWAQGLRPLEQLRVGDWSIAVVHNIEDFNLPSEKPDLLVFGHSHRFSAEKKGGILFLNPGSAGPRRFSLPITMAVLTLHGPKYDLQKITLKNQP